MIKSQEEWLLAIEYTCFVGEFWKECVTIKGFNNKPDFRSNLPFQLTHYGCNPNQVRPA